MFKHFLPAVFILISATLHSQNLFQRKIYLADSLTYSTVRSFEKTDHHFLNMIDFINFNINSFQLHFLETDSDGNAVFYKRYVSSAYAQYNCMDMLQDGKFAVAGRFNNDFMLLTFDSAANMLTAHNYYVGGLSFFESIKHTTGSNYIMCGSRYGPNRGVAMETNSTGTLIWEKEYQVNNHATFFQRAITLRNNNLLFAGQVNLVPSIAVVFIKTDSVGAVLWSLQAGDTTLGMYPESLFELDDSSVIVIGGYAVTGHPTSPFILKLSASGHLLWVHGISSPDFLQAYDAVLVGSNKIAITGYRLPTTRASIFLTMLDTSGTILSSVDYTDPAYDLAARSIINTHDSGFLITGMVPVGNNYISRYLLKTDSAFNSICYKSPVSLDDSSFTLYDSTGVTIATPAINVASIPVDTFIYSTPMPIELNTCADEIVSWPVKSVSGLTAYSFNNFFNVTFSADQSSTLQIRITDITGRIIYQSRLTAIPGANKKEIFIGDLAKGLYIVTLSGEEGSESVKVVKE